MDRSRAVHNCLPLCSIVSNVDAHISDDILCVWIIHPNGLPFMLFSIPHPRAWILHCNATSSVSSSLFNGLSGLIALQPYCSCPMMQQCNIGLHQAHPPPASEGHNHLQKVASASHIFKAKTNVSGTSRCTALLLGLRCTTVCHFGVQGA